MKVCPKCNTANVNDSAFCLKCGENLTEVPVEADPVPVQPGDHTAEFDPKEISEGKVISLLLYIGGTIGLIIALLYGANTNKYVAFHIRTYLKLLVCEMILLFGCIIPFLGWLVAGVGFCIIFVLRIICFFQVCNGKAKDPALIGKFGFLK